MPQLQPNPLPFPINELAINVLSGKWAAKDWMPTTTQCQEWLDRNFWRRVDLACIALRANYHGRAIDECYEHADEDLVMVAVLRRAKEDPTLQAAVNRNWVERSTFDEQIAKYATLNDRELAALARQELECRERQLPLL